MLVQACLDAGKVCERCYNHRGSLQNCFNTVKVCKQPPWKSSDAVAGLLHAGIVCRHHFIHLGRTRAELFMYRERRYNHRGSLQKLVQIPG